MVRAKTGTLAFRYEVGIEAGASRERGRAVVAARPTPAPPKALVVGGGGAAAAVLEALLGQGYDIVGCLDDDPATLNTEVVAGVRVIGTTALLPELALDGVGLAFVGAGAATAGAAREQICARLAAAGLQLPPLVHGRAWVSESSVLGAGTVVMPGAMIGARCRIGRSVVVDQGAQICPDTVVDGGAHVMPGAVIGGGCRIGAATVIGMAATVTPATSVGRDCLIHHRVAVESDVPDATEVRADGRRRRREGTAAAGSASPTARSRRGAAGRGCRARPPG